MVTPISPRNTNASQPTQPTTAPLYVARGGLANVTTQLSSLNSTTFFRRVYRSVEHFIWSRCIELRAFFGALCSIHKTSPRDMQIMRNEMARFEYLVRGCGTSALARRWLRDRFNELQETKTLFVSLSLSTMNSFVMERDLEKWDKSIKRFSKECKTVEKVQHLLAPLRQVLARGTPDKLRNRPYPYPEAPPRARPPAPPAPPVPPTPPAPPGAPLPMTPVQDIFGNHTPPTLVDAAEPARIRISGITGLQKRRAEAIDVMGRFFSETYQAPGDKAPLKEEHLDPTLLDLMTTPVYHHNQNQKGHHLELKPLLIAFERELCCPLCKVYTQPRHLTLNVQMQRDIADKLMCALVQLPDDEIVKSLVDLRKAQRTVVAENGSATERTEAEVSEEMRRLLKKLPASVEIDGNRYEIFSRIANLYATRVVFNPGTA